MLTLCSVLLGRSLTRRPGEAWQPRLCWLGGLGRIAIDSRPPRILIVDVIGVAGRLVGGMLHGTCRRLAVCSSLQWFRCLGGLGMLVRVLVVVLRHLRPVFRVGLL